MTFEDVKREPTADEVELAACPIGLFRSTSGALCLKTGYVAPSGRVEAYIVSSGEFFWGGTRSAAEQRKVLVRPVDAAAILAMDRRAEDALAAEAQRIEANADNYLRGADRLTAFAKARYLRDAAEFLQKRRASPPAPAVAVPENWRLVPKRLTEEMIAAAIAAHYGKKAMPHGMDITANGVNYSGALAMRRFWKGLLAAAPEPPATRSEADIRNEGIEEAGWMPIETAPRDGQIIWAWLNDSGIRAIRWGSAEEWAERDGGSPDEYEDCWVEACDDDEIWVPKWWKPYDAIGNPDDATAIRALKEPRHEP